jgi:hypothetical protein
MTKLVWDEVGERRYETGIDRGVLYPLDGVAVPWNGLVSVAETLGRDTKSYYLDGIKYMDRSTPGAYSAKLQAFTYPDKLEELLGTAEFAPGVRMHDQQSQLFNLSYRTKVGNDTDGTDYGYKIHLVYNVLAVPGDFTHNTDAQSPSVTPFDFQLSGTPVAQEGFRPTAHVSLESRGIDSTLLATLEAQLYGTEEADPSLPALPDLLAMVTP